MDTETPEIEQSALTLVQQTQSVQVTDQATLTQATVTRVKLKAVLKTAAEFFDPQGRAIDAAKSAFLAGRRRVETPLKEAVADIDRKISAYLLIEQTVRAREEMALAEAAQAQAETAQMEQAAALERLGQTGAAEQVLTTPVMAPPPTLPPPTMTGTTTREQWQYAIINPALLPAEYTLPNDVKIGQVVRALKGMTRIPGVRVFSRIVPVASRT